MAATNIAQEISRLTAAKADIKSAIEAKGVTVPSTTLLDGYAALVGQIQQGGAEEAPENDVNFYDYDGFRVASYTISEAKALTALPTPPQHNGLTFQEWNWSLADIQGYNRQYIDIGANYITEDGKTHCFLNVFSGQTISFKLTLTSVIVDWGDGSPTESSTTTGEEFSHSYTTAGSYDLTITQVSGTFYFMTMQNYASFCAACVEIRAGDGFSVDKNYSLSRVKCTLSLATGTVIGLIRGFMDAAIPQINIPKGNWSYNNYYPFQGYGNGRVAFPKVQTRFGGGGSFAYNVKMTHLVVPEFTYTSSGNIQSTDFNYIYGLKVLSLPESAIFISASNGAYFVGCGNLEYIDIVQGWIPNVTSIRLDYSIMWTRENIVRFFGKLGTTQSSITLTFGVYNLAKLSDEDKAIATNKGYTLA